MCQKCLEFKPKLLKDKFMYICMDCLIKKKEEESQQEMFED